MKTYRIYIFITLCLFFAACTSSTSKEKESYKREIGEYLYIDCNDILHSRRTCYAIGETTYNEDSEEYTSQNRGVYFIETNKISTYAISSRLICSRCFTDELYNELLYKVENRGYNPHNEDSLNYRESARKKPKPYNPDDVAQYLRNK